MTAVRTRTRLAGLSLALVVGALAGCAGAAEPVATSVDAAAEAATPESEEPAVRPVVRIASLRGPTTMGLVDLMRDAAVDDPDATGPDYEVTVYGSPDEVVPKVVQGEVDAALLPANLAAVLHARTADAAGGVSQVQVAAVTTLGMLAVMEHGETVGSLEDLAGRTVYSTGKGASPEFVLNHLLRGVGLDPATDVTVEYRSEASEVAALLASTPGAVGVLPQPFATAVTAQNPDVRVAVGLADVWAEVSPDSAMVTGVLIVRRELAESSPDVVAQLLADVEASAAWTNGHPAEAGVLVAEAGIVPSAAVAEKAIPASNITYLDGPDLRAALGGYLEVLHAADPASVGGSLPGDDFYLGP